MGQQFALSVRRDKAQGAVKRQFALSGLKGIVVKVHAGRGRRKAKSQSGRGEAIVGLHGDLKSNKE